MSAYNEPEWLSGQNNDSAANTTETIENANTGATITPSSITESSSGESKAGLALIGLSFLGMGLAGMMAALGVLTLIEVHKRGLGDDFSEPFLASYMILFALLLFGYELMWWTPMPAVNKALRKNFGFMYGLRGKGMYLIFVACLCIGLGNEASLEALNWATGIAFLVVGCLHWFIVCARPELAMKYVAPTAGLIAAEATEEPMPDNVV